MKLISFITVRKDQRYEYVKCEAINDIAIKPEVVDSVSIEMNKILNEKRLLRLLDLKG